ncbi:hypothetical protein ACFPVY_04840 [Flavobacterium qiangtangense]|uniref:Uncharacterized protein n=1 Tax=Flavobacterium qiangtangense TaxID=1442595 RepID=A0ABW1PMC1_9FLAO
MKKLFYAVAVMAFMFTGCSSDDDSSNAEATNIMIDNVPFNQSGAVAPFFSASTMFDSDDESKMRSFQLASFGNGTSAAEQIALYITYPASQASINGTYPVDSFDDANADGGYMKGEDGYFFEEGTVTVTDLGNNKYKLQFNNVIAVDEAETLPNKTFTGSYEGVFTSM